MALLNLSLGAVFHHEGGYADDPSDSGGATNLGITHKTLAAWMGRRAVTKAEVKALTRLEATRIYEARYWNPMRLTEITSQAVAGSMMDFGVNAGIRTAVRKLQQAVNWLNKNDALAEDGRMGPMTLRETNKVSDRALLLKFFELRMRHYHDIAKRRSKDRKFLYAWLKRSLDHV